MDSTKHWHVHGFKPKETKYMMEKRGERGSKSQTEHTDGGGDDHNAAVERWRSTDSIKREAIMESRDRQVMQLPVIRGRKKQRDCDRKLSGVMESGEWEARDRASGENNNRVRLKESLHQHLMNMHDWKTHCKWKTRCCNNKPAHVLQSRLQRARGRWSNTGRFLIQCSWLPPCSCFYNKLEHALSSAGLQVDG